MIARLGRRLPGPLRAFADTLRAEHTNDHDYAKAPETIDEAERERRQVFTSQTFRTMHPVVRVHPVTGERGLYIGGFAQRIIGFAGHPAPAAGVRDAAGKRRPGDLGAEPATG
ncbi:TauD/TfdA family dioxygenase [Amycolatopsis sp. NPDC051071]|uniref:TauD/TfdA dioxygenase family protein n=1 Tax=Amycolatopsis sp. NPDC051071 TaxID=3154637 RepID=UPI00342911AD